MRLLILSLLFCLIFVSPVWSQGYKFLPLFVSFTLFSSFVVDGDQFIKDGQPFTIVSGSIHYFRVHPDLWSDRLQKMRACGLNAITTYVPWNLHQPTKEKKFDFSGSLDLVSFIEQAEQADLLVILRASPYICAEWEFGGLPSWLLNEPHVRLRCSEEVYLHHAKTFLHEVMKRVTPLQYNTGGGPIIAFQVENEYGYFGNDHLYLKSLTAIMESYLHKDSVLFASNGAYAEALEGGATSRLLKTINFGSGSNITQQFSVLRQFQPVGPLFNTEYWVGWFDHWGEEHHTVPAQQNVEDVDEILSLNASISIYMYHGGTSFGWMNGANEGYSPIVNSYDYDAPINESGDPTEKCTLLKKVIAKYMSVPDTPIPPPAPKSNFGSVSLTERASLLDIENLLTLSTPIVSVTTEPMERYGQDYGFILYRSKLRGPSEGSSISIDEVHDRALVWVSGEYLGIIDRNNEQSLPVSVPEGGAQIDILVENQGRINFGRSDLWDPKGITSRVELGGQAVYHWTNYPLPLHYEDVQNLRFESLNGEWTGPSFLRGKLVLTANQTQYDTFVDLRGWTKGVVFFNGFLLGRYWEIGPQRTLYIPAPLLREGVNDIIVFELHNCTNSASPSVNFTNIPILG